MVCNIILEHTFIYTVLIYYILPKNALFYGFLGTPTQLEAFLRGPEVAALIEYCREPRTAKEMLSFMQQRVQIGKIKLVDRVVMPVWKEGAFERFLRKRENFREYLYHVKDTEK